MSKNKKMLEKRVSHKSNQKAHLKKSVQWFLFLTQVAADFLCGSEDFNPVELTAVWPLVVHRHIWISWYSWSFLRNLKLPKKLKKLPMEMFYKILNLDQPGVVKLFFYKRYSPSNLAF